MGVQSRASGKTDYGTPKKEYGHYDAMFGFDLDVCATAENAKCDKYFTPEDNALEQTWTGVCWMNPPYGKDLPKWLEKAYKETRKPRCTVVAFIPASTETKWWHEWVVGKADKVIYHKGRVQFDGAEWPAKYANVAVVYRLA